MKLLILAFALMPRTSDCVISPDTIPSVITRFKRDALLTPFVVPGYSPDLQFTLTAGGICSFRTHHSDSLLPRSSMPVTITYSSSGAFIASTSWVTYWLHDKLRCNGLLQFRTLKDVYFGVGYSDALRTLYPDSTEYRRSYFVIQMRPLWRLGKTIFAGPYFDYSQNILWNINPQMAKDPNYLEFGDKIINTGIGASIIYDTRDFPQNAYTGLLLSATYTLYGRAIGATTHFQALDVDSRFFLPLSTSKIRTLAINWRSRYEFGETPFTYMPSLGSPFDLRGYRYGQFRDRYLNYGIIEYRHKMYFPHGTPSRFGLVAWIGAGAIGRDLRYSMFYNTLWNMGIGFRFEVQPRLNVRLDVGYAPSHAGVYFNFPEAF